MIGTWEEDVFVSLFKVLYSAKVRRKVNEKLWWVPFKRGLFVVGSFYNVLERNDGLYFPWKSVYRTKVPLRVAFFAWLTALRKILTMDNPRKWHVIVLIGVVYVKGTGSSWTIFLSIVKLPVPYGMFSSADLSCLWLCLD